MFERFTDRARRVVVLAQEEARLLNHNYIGTEHLLLGLIHEGEGVASRALQALDVSLEAVRLQVEEVIGEGQAAPKGHIPFTPRAKKVLELSLREAIQLGHNYIGTEHVLLGLVREGQGVAAQVLVKVGADLERVRQQVIEILGRDPALAESGELTAEVEGSSETGAARSGIPRGVERASPGARPRRREGQPERWPLCPRCDADLSQSVRYIVEDVPYAEVGIEAPGRKAAFLFCAECGRVVAANLLEPDEGDAATKTEATEAEPPDAEPGDAAAEEA